jgi:hypothetical protein
MKKQRSSAFKASARCGFAASLAIALLAANAARADITWIFQPSSQISISGQLGQVDGSNTITELYNLAPQTDNNVTLFPGFTNSMVTRVSGTMTSLGNNFLTSLNFGDEPNKNNYNINNAPVVVQNAGNFLPNAIYGASPPYDYGDPIAQNLGTAMVPTGGYANNNDDGGRVSMSNSYGVFSNGTGPKNANGLHTAVPMPVDANGVFNADSLAITGALYLNLAANFSSGQGFFPYPVNGTANAPSGETIPGTITRSGPDYILSASINGITAGTTGSLYYNVNLQYDLVAKANIEPGDANFDGIVNSQDLAAVSSNWLVHNASGLQNGDVNGDGIVNSQDLALISSNWLKTTPTVPSNVLPPVPGGGTPGAPGGPASAFAVPEPSTWVLLGLGSLGLLWQRRRNRR